MIIEAKHTKRTSGQVIILNDDNIPFTGFDTKLEIDSEVHNRQNQPGAYPTNAVPRIRTFEVSGDLYGLDSAEYMLRRAQLVGAISPSFPLLRGHTGVLDVLWSGIGRLLSYVTLTGSELPLDALSPSRSSYMIQWKANDPRMYASTPSQFQLTGSRAVTNRGNTDSPPVVVLNAGGANPRLILDDEYELYFDGLGALPVPITLDFNTKTAKGSNGNDYSDYILGVWWRVPEGTHTVTIQNGSGTMRLSDAYYL